jgi:hypothetical protein
MPTAREHQPMNVIDEGAASECHAGTTAIAVYPGRIEGSLELF